MLKQDELLEKISGRYNEGQTKEENKIKPKVVDGVLKATSEVVVDHLGQSKADGDDFSELKVPHLGTFKAKFVQGGEKEYRNPRSGETFTKTQPDKHTATFSVTAPLKRALDEARGKNFGK